MGLKFDKLFIGKPLMEHLKEIICMFREQKEQDRGRARPDRQNRRVKPLMNANEREQENPPFGRIYLST
jgi:hypothetical protein